jgi:hypothetical protein
MAGAADDFAELAKNLRLVGSDELRRELYKAIDEAAAPVAAEIKSGPHLAAYMPNRYAAVFGADLRVTTHKRTGTDPGVTILGRAPTSGRGGRKIRQRDAGTLTHPLFGNRKRWFTQTAGMRPGFFTRPAEDAAPQVREKILAAMERVANKAVGR